MKEAAVRRLANRVGIENDWVDAAGRGQRVTLGALVRILDALGFPCSTTAELTVSQEKARSSGKADGLRSLLTATAGQSFHFKAHGTSDCPAELVHEDGERHPLTLRRRQGHLIVPRISDVGYHRLRFADHEVDVAIAPPRCVTIADLAKGDNRFGLAVQLYSLPREGDGGIGDTTALRALIAAAAARGVDAIALSPVHSLFASNGAHISPYAPSNRLFLNPLYADPSDALPGASVPVLPAPSQAGLIDWPIAAAAKYAALRKTFDSLDGNEPAAFGEFIRQGADRLREHALFEAVHAYWMEPGRSEADWRRWPREWQGPSAPAVTAYAAVAAREVRYHQFLQWLASASFARAHTAAGEAGMAFGLIADLAIGMDPAGSHAWSRPTEVLTGLSVGAPPDIFIPQGQNWGLAAISPMALVDAGFDPFIATVRAALQHASGVRIDHAMGLMHLWLVPDGAPAAEGAYLRYPLQDLLRLLALESHRHKAVVIGEDLGTVPAQFRSHLKQAGIAGMDVLWFQRSERRFERPSAWRREAVAMTTTHDLPTVAGWWSGSDIRERARLDLAGPDEEAGRKADRARLWRAFVDEGVAADETPSAAEADRAVDAALAFVARSPSPLVVVPVEDLLGRPEQPNLPGTVDQHPNWRRRLPVAAESIMDDSGVASRVKRCRR